MNLLNETIEIIEKNGKLPSQVLWVGTDVRYFSWEEFKSISDFEYDEGFGGNEIKDTLKVVGSDWWLERHEYDGSEWWEFKSLPEKPLNSVVPLKEDLLEHF